MRSGSIAGAGWQLARTASQSGHCYYPSQSDPPPRRRLIGIYSLVFTACISMGVASPLPLRGLVNRRPRRITAPRFKIKQIGPGRTSFRRSSWMPCPRMQVTELQPVSPALEHFPGGAGARGGRLGLKEIES